MTRRYRPAGEPDPAALPTAVNGQPAVGCYIWDDDAGCYVASVLDVLTLRDNRIAAVTAFLTPEVLAEVGLPERLPAV